MMQEETFKSILARYNMTKKASDHLDVKMYKSLQFEYYRFLDFLAVPRGLHVKLGSLQGNEKVLKIIEGRPKGVFVKWIERQGLKICGRPLSEDWCEHWVERGKVTLSMDGQIAYPAGV